MMLLIFHSKKYIELKKKNIINVHFIYTRENNIIVFICVPKNIDNTLIHVADTKKIYNVYVTQQKG